MSNETGRRESKRGKNNNNNNKTPILIPKKILDDKLVSKDLKVYK